MHGQPHDGQGQLRKGFAGVLGLPPATLTLYIREGHFEGLGSVLKVSAGVLKAEEAFGGPGRQGFKMTLAGLGELLPADKRVHRWLICR